MKTYPIIFSGPMVRALLDGRKTMTRRLAWTHPVCTKFLGSGDAYTREGVGGCFGCDGEGTLDRPTPWLKRYERFQEGERPWLWVREKHWAVERCGQGVGIPHLIYDDEWNGCYPDERAPLRPCGLDFGPHPSIHMFRWASRLSLEVTDMKRERLTEISEADARAEGVDAWLQTQPESVQEIGECDPVWAFQGLWNSIHGPGAWGADPSVIAVSFRVHQRNIDAIAAGRQDGE